MIISLMLLVSNSTLVAGTLRTNGETGPPQGS